MLLLVTLVGFSVVGGPRASAQEFNASVTVQAPTVQAVDQTVFQQMQKDIMEYMNNTRFTKHAFLPEERLKVRINIVIQEAPSNDRFHGNATFQLTRPVYNSTYETLLYNFNDQDFRINYVPFQQMQYSENTFVNNLTSILNFHALMMLGFDYDSFSPSAGVPYMERARNILNLAQNSNEPGWQAMDGRRNRYWLVENMLNNSYKVLHSIYYRYHREGLDVMADDVAGGRQTILATLQDMKQLFVQNPNIYMLRVFLDSKRGELIKIFSNGFPDDKQKFIQTMQQLDPRNMDKYNAVLQESN